MEFKDILVHIDDTPQSATRLKLAVKIARRHDAHLTGIHVVTHPHYRPSVVGTEERRAVAEKLFRFQTSGWGVKGEWLAVESPVSGGDPVEAINHYAFRKDLVIVGQGEPGPDKGAHPQDLAERVVMGAGRPVLVVPYAGNFEMVGDRVLVAWKNGRASARALADAIPILKGAKEVRLLTVDSGSVAPVSDPGTVEGVATHLQRHSIKSTTENLAVGGISIAHALMNYAWENGCDLLVMGAYAHSLRGVLTVGPVARELFEQMTVPVLMSH